MIFEITELPRLISDAFFGLKPGERASVYAEDGKMFALIGNPNIAGQWRHTYIDIPAPGTELPTWGNGHNPHRVRVVSIGTSRMIQEDVGDLDEEHNYEGFRKTGTRSVRVQEIIVEAL